MSVAAAATSITTPSSKELATRGFTCFFRGSLSQSTVEVAQSCGQVLEADGVAAVQVLVPKQSEGLEKSSYSGMYGTQFFPLHTDMAHWHVPPRYFLLRCIEPANNVFTYFVHSDYIFGAEDKLDLKRGLFRPRRRLDGRLTCFRLREGECYRWDPAFIQPVNNLAFGIRARILERLAMAQPEAVALTVNGYCILVDNWKTLHGRSAIAEDAVQRRIERVYLTSVNL